ncbi:MAG: hypothetical protein P8K78_05690 [Pirellulales bacterium]|nr:hypothetical protein [Pirellulales bacterium]
MGTTFEYTESGRSTPAQPPDSVSPLTACLRQCDNHGATTTARQPRRGNHDEATTLRDHHSEETSTKPTPLPTSDCWQ